MASIEEFIGLINEAGMQIETATAAVESARSNGDEVVGTLQMVGANGAAEIINSAMEQLETVTASLTSAKSKAEESSSVAAGAMES